MTFFVFLLALGSALRLTRLAVADTIAQPFRSWLGRKYAYATHRAAVVAQSMTVDQPTAAALDGPLQRGWARRATLWLWLIELFECPWCIGFWISGAVSAATLAAAPVPFSLWVALPALTLSISYLVGVIYTAVYTLELYDPRDHS